MKSNAKNTIKTVTLTLDELNKIVADSASGNVEAAKNLIATKVNEKSERLQKQRELRRQRNAQKKAEQPKSSTTNDAPQTLTLPLSRDLAKCILWINNRRDALKSNISRLLHEIARSGGSKSSLADINCAMQWLLLWAKEAAPAAHNHLYAKYPQRPKSARIECGF